MIATKIQEYMKDHTQQELATAVGVSRSAVCLWVMGRRRPNRWIMAQVLDVLGAWNICKLDEKDVWPK